MERYVPETPHPDTAARIERALGARPVRWLRAHGGIAPTDRWVVRCDDDTSAFVKLGTSEHTTDAVRDEARFLSALGGVEFAPRFGGFEDGEPPMLWIEDLSHADWPPPWTQERIERVLQTLARVRRLEPPEGAPPTEQLRAALDGWAKVEEDPAGFLAIGLATEGWLRAALPTLRAASDDARLDGTDTLHMDVRSDNICFDGARTVLVDWNWVSTGNGDFDIAAWLGSLHAEGGPLPEEILPDAGPEAAFIASYFASRAGQPPLDGVPRLRPIQLAQLRVTLPWAARALGLPPPDLMEGATR